MATAPWCLNDLQRIVKGALTLLIFAFLATATPAAADSLYTRNLDCPKRFAARELEICKALERDLARIPQFKLRG